MELLSLLLQVVKSEGEQRSGLSGAVNELLPGKCEEQHLAHVKCLFNQNVYLNLTGLQQGSQTDWAPGMLGGS